MDLLRGLVLLIAAGYLALVGFAMLILAAYYAAAWVLATLSVASLIFCAWRRNSEEEPPVSMIVTILLLNLGCWALNLIGRYPDQWETFCAAFTRTVTR